MMKIGLSILGALIGPFVGFIVAILVCAVIPHPVPMGETTCGAVRGVAAIGTAIVTSLFVGAPLGLVTFCLIGLWLGSLLDRRAKANVAASDEERKMLAERGGETPGD
jgi:Na+/H+ antiporter NhaA